MSEGNRSRWVKYDGSAVWNPAAVMASVARTALRRRDTTTGQTSSARQHWERTVAALAYDRVEHGYEVGHDGVGIVEAGEDRDDVGAGVGVLFGKGGVKEDCQGLASKPAKPWGMVAGSFVPRGRSRRPAVWPA